MHVHDFDDDYLPLAKIDDDMLLCLHTAAANASDMFYFHPRITRTSTAALTKKRGAQLLWKSSWTR
eukprot:1410837-Pleurochrysis_carterae.AAC.1